MENILNKINSRCVSLNDTETKRNNVILHKVISIVIKGLQDDKLFQSLYEKEFYGGSFYDGLKVGNSTEFDIDMILVLPRSCSPTVKSSNKPGFVHMSLTELEKLEEKYKGLEKLCDANTKQISAKKTLSWIESLMAKCFNKLCPPGTALTTVPLGGKNYSIMVKLKKSGPASTMIIVAKATDSTITMDVDLVPCFQFCSKSWPSKSSGYRQWNSSKYGKSDKFLAVPKLPTDVDKPDFYWRLSFQEQEREMISGNALGRLKPALRLLKKIRDHWNHPISSYYIKTVFLWEADNRSKDFWNRPLTTVFYEMLKIYGERLRNGSIEYFWNKKYNLISNMKKTTLDGIANQIYNIVGKIDRMSEDDPFVVATFIVSQEEVEILRREVDLGKNKKKLLLQATSSSSTPASSSASTSGQRAQEVGNKSVAKPDVNSLISILHSTVKQNKILLQKTTKLEDELKRFKL